MKIKVSQLVFFFFFQRKSNFPSRMSSEPQFTSWHLLPGNPSPGFMSFSAIVYFYPGRVMLTRSLLVDGVSWEVIAREAPKRMSYRILLGP